jgi:Spy/CpxP family protein refolding chaperone
MRIIAYLRRTTIPTVLAAMLWLLGSVVSLAPAQQPGGVNPTGVPDGARFVVLYRSNPAFQWIGVEAVQEDLKLTDRQKEQIKTVRKAIAKKEQARDEQFGDPLDRRAANLANAPDPANPQPIQVTGGYVNAGQAIEREIDATYSTILTGPQLQRLNQIHWQYLGPFAIVEVLTIQEILDLGEQQLFQLRAVDDEYIAEQRAIQSSARAKAEKLKAAGGKPASSENQKQLAEFGDAAAKQYAAAKQGHKAAYARILTKPQRDAFNNILGKPFDVSKLRDAQIAEWRSRTGVPAADGASPGTPPNNTGSPLENTPAKSPG